MADNNLRADLQTLYSLQQLDSERDAMSLKQRDLPRQLQKCKQDLENAHAELTRFDATLAELESARTKLEQETRFQEERIKKSQQRLTQVHTSEEYHAVEREVDAAKERIAKIEEDILKTLDLLETQKQRRPEFEAAITALEAKLHGQESELESQLQAAGKFLVDSEAQRGTLAQSIKDAYLKSVYENLRRKSPVAMVAVEKEFCPGCRMSFPPQLLNMTQRCEQFQQCPNCGRLMYWQPQPDQQPQAAAK